MASFSEGFSVGFQQGFDPRVISGSIIQGAQQARRTRRDQTLMEQLENEGFVRSGATIQNGQVRFSYATPESIEQEKAEKALRNLSLILDNEIKKKRASILDEDIKKKKQNKQLKIIPPDRMSAFEGRIKELFEQGRSRDFISQELLKDNVDPNQFKLLSESGELRRATTQDLDQEFLNQFLNQ